MKILLINSGNMKSIKKTEKKQYYIHVYNFKYKFLHFSHIFRYFKGPCHFTFFILVCQMIMQYVYTVCTYIYENLNHTHDFVIR